MLGVLRRAERRHASVAALVGLALAVAVPCVLAHRVIVPRDSRQTALVQSPTASPADLPVPIFTTGLSVICFRVTNTSTIPNRVTAIGLDLPGDRSGFALVSPVAGGVQLRERVGPIPGFPNVLLDFALVAGGSLPSPRPGLAPNAPPITLCVSGPFDAAVPIETMLNGVFVAFENDTSPGSGVDIGVWERR